MILCWNAQLCFNFFVFTSRFTNYNTLNYSVVVFLIYDLEIRGNNLGTEHLHRNFFEIEGGSLRMVSTHKPVRLG